VEMSQLPVFETERLILRGVTERDIPAYERGFVDYEVIRYLTRLVPWPYPEGGVTDYFMNKLLPRQGNDVWVWGIFLKENDTKLIGAIELRRDITHGNRGFWVAREHCGERVL